MQSALAKVRGADHLGNVHSPGRTFDLLRIKRVYSPDAASKVVRPQTGTCRADLS